MNGFRLARQADADLDEIADYIADRNPSAALRQIDAFYQKFALLGRQPLMGQSCGHLRPGLRCFSAGTYVIFYVPRDDGIEVERVVHGARDITSMF
jgi:toxin ParE1/3/4